MYTCISAIIYEMQNQNTCLFNNIYGVEWYMEKKNLKCYSESLLWTFRQKQ